MSLMSGCRWMTLGTNALAAAVHGHFPNIFVRQSGVYPSRFYSTVYSCCAGIPNTILGSQRIPVANRNLGFCAILNGIDKFQRRRCSSVRVSHRENVIIAPTMELNNGCKIPVFGLGTYKSKDNEAELAVKHAIDCGYRHIDTAYVYRNENEVGKAIQEKINEGVIKREDIFVTTKLWNIHHSPEKVETACRDSLKRLGLDYVDLYLIHWPVGYVYVDEETMAPEDENGKLRLSDVDYLDTWKEMEKLVKLGLTRSIGLSNFNSEQCDRILKNCEIKPVTNQVECHAALNQKKLRQFCKDHDMVLTAYSPLQRPRPEEKKPDFLYSDKTKAIADKYNKTPAQIVLRYLSRDEEGELAVKHAIDCGYRHIDTAFVYLNENEVGEAIQEKINEGVITREDIFVTTKLWNIHHDPEKVETACRDSLSRLGLDYVDLYLIHFPVGYDYVDEETIAPEDEDGKLRLSDVDYLDTWKEMENLVKLGLTRSIGLSNFNSEQCDRILQNCEIKPVTNQVECHPALNQKKLRQFCKDHDMVLTAYSPLQRPRPEEGKPDFLYSDKTKAIADKYNKTPAQIVLRYLHEIETIPIPKSSNFNRIEENFDIFDFELSDEDISEIETFNVGERCVPFESVKEQNHKYFPFDIE